MRVGVWSLTTKNIGVKLPVNQKDKERAFPGFRFCVLSVLVLQYTVIKTAAGHTGILLTPVFLLRVVFVVILISVLLCLTRKSVQSPRNNVFYHRTKGEHPERNRDIKSLKNTAYIYI